MKFHEILALHFFDAGDGAGAGERIAVGVARPVQKSREHAQAHLDGRGLFALDGGELQLLLLFEVVFRENGIQNEVGKQFERGIEFGLQRGQTRDGHVQIGIRRDLRAQQGLFVANLQRAPRFRAAIEKRHGHARGPRERGGIGSVARVDIEPEGDQGNLMALREDDFQSVRQGGSPKFWEF